MDLPIDMESDEPVGVPYKAVFRFDTGDVHFEGVIPFGAYKSAQAEAPSEREVLPPLPEPDFRDEWTDQKLDWWSADMMRAYARTAVAAALGRGAVPQITSAQAMDALKRAFVADPNYAWTWHCAVWAAAHDEGMETSAANRAAARLMSMAFDVDTSKHENFADTQVAPTPPATQQVVQGEPVVWKLAPVEPTKEILAALGNPWDGANRATWARVIAALAPGRVERDREDADYLCKLVDAICKDVLGVLKQYGDAQAAIGLMASRTKEAIRAARSSEGGDR